MAMTEGGVCVYCPAAVAQGLAVVTMMESAPVCDGCGQDDPEVFATLLRMREMKRE